MIVHSSTSSASTCWPARPSRRPSSSTRCRPAEALGLGSAFISERFNIKEAVTLSGAVGADVAHAGHRHGRHEPQHPPPAGDGVVRHDDAPPHRRAVHARPRSRASRRCSTPSASRGSPPRSSRTSSAWCAGSSTVRSSSATTARPDRSRSSHLDSSFDEDIPHRLRGVRAELARAGRAGDGHGGAAHVLHRRDHRAVRPNGARGRRAGGPRPVVGAHLVVLRDRSTTVSPRTCG